MCHAARIGAHGSGRELRESRKRNACAARGTDHARSNSTESGPHRSGSEMRGERYRTARAARIGLAGVLTVLAGAAAGAVHARDQSRGDAWWTGPMLAPSVATLPSGHMLIEPYLFDVMSD